MLCSCVRCSCSYEHKSFSAVLALVLIVPLVFVVMANSFLSLFLRFVGSSLQFLVLNENVRLTVCLGLTDLSFHIYPYRTYRAGHHHMI